MTPDGVSLCLGPPVALFDLENDDLLGRAEIFTLGNNVTTEYDVLPDGRFVMLRLPARRITREIVLLRNWFARAPAPIAALAPKLSQDERLARASSDHE